MICYVLKQLQLINGDKSQIELAIESGLSRIYIQDLLNGVRQNPSQQALEKLAITFNIQIDELKRIIEYSNKLDEILDCNNISDLILLKSLIAKEISSYYINSIELVKETSSEKHI